MKDDLANVNDLLNKTEIIESCSRERMNSKWKFYKLTNLTVPAALLKDVPGGCKDAVLPKTLLRNGTIKTISLLQKIHDNDITIVCGLFGSLVSVYMALNNWKKQFQKFLIYSSINWMNLVPFSFRESI